MYSEGLGNVCIQNKIKMPDLTSGIELRTSKSISQYANYYINQPDFDNLIIVLYTLLTSCHYK